MLERDFPIERQKRFAEAAAASLGFDLESGRLDVGQHPFCSMIGPGDVRVALRYDPRNFRRGSTRCCTSWGTRSTIRGSTPTTTARRWARRRRSALHESQSRMWENHVGRSHGFWRHFYPKLCDAFPEALHDVSLDAFRRAVNHVAPGDPDQADEVTYDLHIAIRFELELALLSGDLRGADLPGAWNELYQRHLGVRRRTTARGVCRTSTGRKG